MGDAIVNSKYLDILVFRSNFQIKNLNCRNFPVYIPNAFAVQLFKSLIKEFAFNTSVQCKVVILNY